MSRGAERGGTIAPALGGEGEGYRGGGGKQSRVTDKEQRRKEETEGKRYKRDMKARWQVLLNVVFLLDDHSADNLVDITDVALLLCRQIRHKLRLYVHNVAGKGEGQ